MRKVGMILVILVTGYFAGVYRNEPLMAMAVTEVLLLAVMWVLSFLLKRNLSVGFASSSGEAVIGSKPGCGVVIRNRGLLPVSRFRLSLSSGYEGGRKRSEIVYGGTLRGEQRRSVELDCRHCGIARVSAEKVRVYDYLSLFSSQKNIWTSMIFMVYPKDLAANISLVSLKEAQQTMQSGTATTPYAGGNDEIRLLREYHEGDSVRHVHWNLTARMDELWVREYDSERDVPLRFFIDLRGLSSVYSILGFEGRVDTNQSSRRRHGGLNEPNVDANIAADRFFQVLYSLLLGLLEDAGYIRVWWRGSDIFEKYGAMAGADEEDSSYADGTASVMDIRDRDDCRKLLRCLYLERVRRPEQMAVSPMPDEAGSLISFDTDLNWRVDGQLVWHFSPDGYEEEIRNNVFEL